MAEYKKADSQEQEKADRTRQFAKRESDPLSRNFMSWDTDSYLARQLHQTYGNRYMQGLVRSASLQLQRQMRATREADIQIVQRSPTDPSREVPALMTSTVQQVKAALQEATQTSRQRAVNLIVNSLIASGVIDGQRLENRKMVYLPGFAPPGQGGGLTSLTPGTGRPRPCRVRIGDMGVTSASTLYSTIMHEYQHVNQFWDNARDSEDIGEIQAYLYEIEHLRESGLNKSVSQLMFLRRQLVAYWDRASSNPEARAPYQQRYDAALLTIEDRMRQIQLGR